MYLRYITCSDPREHNPLSEVIRLGVMPRAEIAVQCHPSKMSDSMPRNIWFGKLLHQLYDIKRMNLAIHINQEWANEICVNGNIPDILLNWIKARNSHNNPIIKRIQLNMPKITAQNIDPNKIAQIIHDFRDREFIFQYNDNTKSAIEKIHASGAKFSLLFDASGGCGISPSGWQKPIYKTHPMGYSGGLSPDNIVHNLRQINMVVQKNTGIWIDAEGRLKSNDLFDEKPKFDADLARIYIKRANTWQNQR